MNNEEKILDLLEALVTDVVGIKQEMSGMNQRIAGIKQEMSGMNQRLAFVEGSVVRIENEHGKRLDLLFEGLLANQENTVRIEGKLDRLDTKNAEEHMRTQAAISDLARATKTNTSDIVRLKPVR